MILRGIEPDREDRWTDVLSFVEALAAAVPGAPVSLYERAQPPRSRGSRPAGLSTAMLAVLCLVVLVATFGASYAVVEMLQ